MQIVARARRHPKPSATGSIDLKRSAFNPYLIPPIFKHMRGALSFCLLAFFYLLLTPFDKASDLPVIKDSEAAQFVGQNVEVQGLVVAVTTSRKGNTFINFGVPYPNQTFTGWIPQGRLWRLTRGKEPTW
jgi:hypothetical protein